MAKAAVLRKVDMKQAKKTASKAPAKASGQKKPVLKVVTSTAKKAPPARKVPAAKPAAQKIAKAAPARKASSSGKAARPVAKPPVVAKAPVKTVAPKAPVNHKAVAKKEGARLEFRIGDYVVYPTHGVGRIQAEETQMIGGISLRMLVIAFDKDRMTLRVPVARATAAGLRHISGSEQMQRVFGTLKSRARISRGMWSRRAQEYEAKINSGNIVFIAEVVRDLHPNVDQAERSYSERMIYESALGRLVGELAAAERTDHKIATDKLMKLLRSKAA